MRVEQVTNVLVGAATVMLVGSIILAQHPNLRVQLENRLRYLTYYTWYYQLPQWKREAYKVRGLIQ